MLRYMDDFGVGASHFRALMAEDHIRAAQLLRGQVPSKRVASKKAIGQLQSVELDSLSETERSKSADFSPWYFSLLLLTCPRSVRHLL